MGSFFSTRKKTAFLSLIVVVVVILMGIPTLWYPNGRDQGQYSYFAREWLQGSTPYQDMWDQKFPAFYLIILIFHIVFGFDAWVIRLGDLIAVSLLSLLLFGIGKKCSEKYPLLMGFCSALPVPFLYFGGFTYWDTAQAEIWVIVFCTAALRIALNSITPLSLFTCFSSISLATLIKLPASLLVIPLILSIYFQYSQRKTHNITSIVLYSLLGFILPFLIVIVPLVTKTNIFHDMWETVITYNAFYVAAKSDEVTMLDLVWQPVSFQLELPIMAVFCLFGMVLINRVVHRNALFIILSWFISSYFSLMLQRKYYLYHYIILIPPLCVIIGAGLAWLLKFLWQAPKILRVGGIVLLASLFLAGHIRPYYREYVTRWYEYITQQMGWFRFYSQFGGPDDYSFMNNAKIAQFINWNKTEGDTLAVEGFEPAIYLLTNLRCPSRFYSIFPLIDPKLKGFNREWHKRYEEDLKANAPRWIVTTSIYHFFPTDTYQKVEQYGKLSVWLLTPPGGEIPELKKEDKTPPKVIRK